MHRCRTVATSGKDDDHTSTYKRAIEINHYDKQSANSTDAQCDAQTTMSAYILCNILDTLIHAHTAEQQVI